LDHLFNQKYGEKVYATKIVEANDNFQQVNRPRKKLIMTQDDRVSAINTFHQFATIKITDNNNR
jgi:hypothetical protein